MQYILANPTGNITALVTEWGTQNGGIAESDADMNERLTIVKEIFDTEPSCEQVGFVRVTGERCITLEMMGGEFCGNATLSAAAYCARANKLFSGDGEATENTENAENSLVITVDSSGTDKPVPVELRCLDAETGEYEGTLEMTMPQLEENGIDGSSEWVNAVVHLDGISHMIVPAESISHEEAEAVIKGYAEQFDALAFGMLMYSEKTDSSESTESDVTSNTATVHIEPLVYVKGSDTMVWEHGCASGSIAAAYYKYVKSRKFYNSEGTGESDKDDTFTVNVHQPGGVISIEIADDKLYLTGKIQL